MKVRATELPGVLLVEPAVFGDARGFFQEVHQQERYAAVGVAPEGFVQDNLSRSAAGVVRGLHFQEPGGQGKLVQVLEGAVFDVAVDVRAGSPTFCRWVGFELSAANHRQLYIPPGFAHGFAVTQGPTLFLYKCTRPYDAQSERAIAWNDPQIAVRWPLTHPDLSARDAVAPALASLDMALLPRWEAR